MNMLLVVKNRLKLLSNQEKSLILQRFFKTGKGEYGEGDIFIGITIPQIRSIVKEFWRDVSFEDIENLLQSKIHEERTLAMSFLVHKFEKTKDKVLQEEIVNFYLKPSNIKQINNWDLVDLSCYKILGRYLIENLDKVNILYDFVKSDNLWKKRISIVTTFAFIKEKQLEHTVNLAKILLADKHNLIHKATGWMLREVGKQDKQALLDFLNTYANKMPRIALSYAVERLTDEDRKFYRDLR